MFFSYLKLRLLEATNMYVHLGYGNYIRVSPEKEHILTTLWLGYLNMDYNYYILSLSVFLHISIFKYFHTIPALSDWKLVEEPHVVNQNIEESDLVSKPCSDVEAGWMNCHTVYLLPEPLIYQKISF